MVGGLLVRRLAREDVALVTSNGERSISAINPLCSTVRKDAAANCIACIHLMKTHSAAKLINIGSGEHITIAQFARVVADVIEYLGEITLTPHAPMALRAICSSFNRLTGLDWEVQTSLKSLPHDLVSIDHS